MKIHPHDTGCDICAAPGERLADCDPAVVAAHLRRSGWVCFSGFDVTLPEFEAFAGRFGTCAGARDVHYPESGSALGFHAEDAYNPYRPDAIWFLCLFEGSDGGVPTSVVDGVRLLEEMPSEWQAFSRVNRLRFDRHWSAATWYDGVGRHRRAELDAALAGIPGITHQFFADDSVYVGYEAPMVVRTASGRESFSNSVLQAVSEPSFYGISLHDGSPVPTELARSVHVLGLRTEMPLGWKAGQVAVIDNIRMMHRRSEYLPSDRDLRAMHGEDLFGSILPDASSRVAAWAKRLIQGDEGYPVRVGRPLVSAVWSRGLRTCSPT